MFGNLAAISGYMKLPCSISVFSYERTWKSIGNAKAKDFGSWDIFWDVFTCLFEDAVRWLPWGVLFREHLGSRSRIAMLPSTAQVI